MTGSTVSSNPKAGEMAAASVCLLAGLAIAIWWFDSGDTPETTATSGQTGQEQQEKTTSRKHLVLIGRSAVVTSAFPACRSNDDMSRIKQLAFQKDGEAAALYAREKDCSFFQKGDAGLVEDVSVWSGTSCLRPRGQPYCRWFPNMFLEASAER